MKNILIIILILLSKITYSQDFDYIKKLDTIYIPFQKGKYNLKIDYPEEKDGFKNRSYIFNYKKKDAHYFDFELKKTSNRALDFKMVDKLYLRKVRKKTVPINNLKRFNYQDIQCELFTRIKTYYIIDLSEKRNKKYTIYKVMHINSCSYKE
ncbi:hypothetical protein JI750_18760 [Flavobacterium sp. GN10]|uniref:Uncharacterized protein n=1 Tax=Flavobacterium tagetis TaxID=2801336 RepID=A0ABS1KI57_9FLAO|nr:hypothetical protein [Flavobacterium tagetis]MBL0738943.1 hypothetical protein [Flavobacterium tagetis]